MNPKWGGVLVHGGKKLNVVLVSKAFVCLFSFLPSLESCPCRGSQYIFRVSRSAQFSFLTSEHGKDPFRNLFFFLRKQLESVGSLHLSKS